MPKISIITAVKNGAIHLPETIDSILNQTYTDWEYIIVDDGSDDNTAEIVNEYSKKDARVKLIQRKESAGPYIAANDGIKAAEGKYIARIDGDDIMLPTRLEKQLAFLENNPEYKCVASYCQWLDADGPVRNSYIKAPNDPVVLNWHLAIRNPLIHSSAFFEKKAFEEIGLYKEKFLSQDYRMFADFAFTSSLTVLPEVLVYFRKHEKRVTHKSKPKQDELAREVLLDHINRLAAKSSINFNKEEVNAIFDMAYIKTTNFKLVKEAVKKLSILYSQEVSPSVKKELNDYLNFRLKKLFRSNFRTSPVKAILSYLTYKVN